MTGLYPAEHSPSTNGERVTALDRRLASWSAEHGLRVVGNGTPTDAQQQELQRTEKQLRALGYLD